MKSTSSLPEAQTSEKRRKQVVVPLPVHAKAVQIAEVRGKDIGVLVSELILQAFETLTTDERRALRALEHARTKAA